MPITPLPLAGEGGPIAPAMGGESKRQAVLTPPPGRAARPVFEHDALGGELGADAVGVGEAALLARQRTRGDLRLDAAASACAASQPFERATLQQPQHSRAAASALQPAALRVIAARLIAPASSCMCVSASGVLRSSSSAARTDRTSVGLANRSSRRRPARPAPGRSGRASAAPGAAARRSSPAGRGNASASSARRITSPGACASASRTVMKLPRDFDILAPPTVSIPLCSQ